MRDRSQFINVNGSLFCVGKFSAPAKRKIHRTSLVFKNAASGEWGQMFGFLSRRNRQEDLPLEIYASLVDWLYDGSFALLSGGTAASLAILMTAWRTQYWALWLCAALCALVTVVRTIDMYIYFGQG